MAQASETSNPRTAVTQAGASSPVLSYQSGVAAAPPSAWSPLRIPIFRAMWLAYLVSLIGTWAREAGGPWLMTKLTEGQKDSPLWVSLIQTAGTLPICLLSIAAGVLADIYDRRKLLILTNVWMLLASGSLAVMTLAGAATPVNLLTFTAILGVGAALSGPAFQYVMPELVGPRELPQAIALNSVALNVARAVGPALGMWLLTVVAVWTGSQAKGAGASFAVNAAAFVGVIWVLWKWKKQKPDAAREGGAAGPVKKHKETIWGATRTAFVYTANSPALLAILVRVAAFIMCAVIVWAQLSIVAKVQLKGDTGTFGVLMAAVGLGAVIGVMFMPMMDKRFSTEGMVAMCTACFGVALMALSQCKGQLANLGLASALAMVIGFNWVIVPTNFNIATQRSVPNWVKGRAIAMYMTVLFGSFAIGSPIWGKVASVAGISNASLIAGSLILLGLLLVKPFPLTRARGQDLSPANQAAAALPESFAPGAGAVQVVVEYVVETSRAREFAEIMNREARRQCKRNGAARWHLEMRSAGAEREVFVETVTYAKWRDRLLALARMTKADVAMVDRLAAFHAEAGGPRVSYLNSARAAEFVADEPATALPWKVEPIVDWRRIVERATSALDAVWDRVVKAMRENRK